MSERRGSIHRAAENRYSRKPARDLANNLATPARSEDWQKRSTSPAAEKHVAVGPSKEPLDPRGPVAGCPISEAACA